MRSISAELIRKYLRGECSPEEQDLVIKWYQSFDEKPDPYLELPQEQRQELKERMLNRIITQSDLGKVRTRPVFFSIRSIYYVLGIASVFILIFQMPVLLGYLQQRNQLNEVHDDVVIINRSGSILKQILPDQSIVWLSPHAQISFKKHFVANLREVNLSGESFFEVTKDSKHPFVIYSKHIVTKVWGTSFRIRDVQDDSEGEVAVVTGKVSVKKLKSDANPVMLLPRQMVSFSDHTKDFQIREVHRNSSLNIWKKASLAFDNKPLKEIIATLNIEFSVEILVQDPNLNDFILQADFDGQSLPDIMQILSKLLNRTYTTDGHQFILQK